MKSADEIATEYASIPIDAKSNWYSPAALSYYHGRPEYPNTIISKIISETGINSSSKILEIGSGPGTATQSFSNIGCNIDCVEPNRDFINIAQHRFKNNLNIFFRESTFENYVHFSADFDIVLAATSFHWIEKELAFKKSATLLNDSGYLVLLWNNELQPDLFLSNTVREIYHKHAPDLFKNESEDQIVKRLESISHWFIDNDYFEISKFGFIVSKVRYSTKRYIKALESYTPYIKLEDKVKNSLFKSLSNFIDEEHDGVIDLKYVTGYHVAKKASQSVQK